MKTVYKLHGFLSSCSSNDTLLSFV